MPNRKKNKQRPLRIFVDRDNKPYYRRNNKKVRILTNYKNGQLATKIINNYYEKKKARRRSSTRKSTRKPAPIVKPAISSIFTEQVAENIKALSNDNTLALLDLKNKELELTRQQKEELLENVKKNALAASMLITVPEIAEKDFMVKMTKKQFAEYTKQFLSMKGDKEQAEGKLKKTEKEQRRSEKDIHFENNFINNQSTGYFNKLAKDLGISTLTKQGNKSDLLRRPDGSPMTADEQKEYIKSKVDARSLKKFFETKPSELTSEIKTEFVEAVKNKKVYKPKREKEQLPIRNRNNIDPEETASANNTKGSNVELFPEYQITPLTSVKPNEHPLVPAPADETKPTDQQADGLRDNKSGLYSTDIQEIVKLLSKNNPRLKQSWKGVYSIDQLDDIAKKCSPNDRYISFVLNLDPSNKPGTHWVSVWIDTLKGKEICYYDSFGEKYPLRFTKDISLIINKIKPEYYLMLKYNKIKYQSVSSDNCGWFAVQFIFNMSHKNEFKDATGYTSIEKSEDQIEKFADKTINLLV